MNDQSFWISPTSDVEVGAGQVHAWRIALEQPSPTVVALRRHLSDEEIRKADRFHAEGDRSRFAVGRAAMRMILAGYAGEMPGRIRFQHNPNGKPLLDRTPGGITFNLSHSAAWAVLVVARDRLVGVDIERLRPIAERDRIAAGFFSRREALDFLALADERKTEAFYRTWTCKEAYLKAIGLGLSLPMDAFEVPVPAGSQPVPFEVRGIPDQPTGWTVTGLSPQDGYAGALVVEGAGWELRTFTFCVP